MTTHHGKVVEQKLRPFKCRYCTNRFATSGDRLRHERYLHTKVKPYGCEFCPARFVEGNKLKRHQLVHTGRRDFQCQHCTYAAADKFKLIRHLRVHTGEKPYHCPVCFRKFSQQNSMKSHFEAKHSVERRWFYCDMCEAKCGRMTDLRKHKQAIHSHKTVACRTCGEVFPDRYTLSTHRKTHRGQVFHCTLCPLVAPSRALLKAHSVKHYGKKSFSCTSCPLTFCYKTELNRHRREEHLPSRLLKAKRRGGPMKCPHCERSFKYLKRFQQHVLEHDDMEMKIGELEQTVNDKALSCDVCGKQFKRPKWFEKHKRGHEEEEERQDRVKDWLEASSEGGPQRDVAVTMRVRRDLTTPQFVEQDDDCRSEKEAVQDELCITEHEILFNESSGKNLVVPISNDVNNNNNNSSAVVEIIDEIVQESEAEDDDIAMTINGQDQEEEDWTAFPFVTQLNIDMYPPPKNEKLNFSREEVSLMTEEVELGSEVGKLVLSPVAA